jgi:hypothetical protein
MRAKWVLPLVLCLSGCNWINHITGLTKDSDKAIGAACRQTGRSLEECYIRNPDADKAQVYAGWREMHEYMTKENLPTMSPPPPPPAPVAPAAAAGQKSDNGSPDQPGQSSENKVDPEVQAVLDTINNRSSNHSNAPQPTAAEQQQMQQLLNNPGSSQKKK